MRRRELLSMLCGGAAIWPLVAHAQHGARVRRVGVLMAGAPDADGERRIAALRDGLHALGWIEGRNLQVEARWASGDTTAIQKAAADLVGLAPDAIMANGNRTVAALRRETRTIPIVFAGLSDPVANGFVESMARPGGNVTGFVHFQTSLLGKMLEVLKEISPKLERAALLETPTDPATAARRQPFENAATALGLRASSIPMHDIEDMERGLALLGRAGNGGLIVVPSANVIVHRHAIIAAAARHHVPAVYPFRLLVIDGGLMYYGADVIDLTRRAAGYIDRILRGARAAELPVQTPTRYQMIVNLKTAKALKLTVPPIILSQADEVIE